MRLFQNSSIYQDYRPRLAALTAKCNTFLKYRNAFLHDRYGAVHFLKPVLEGDPASFFTNGDDRLMQSLWAKENGLSHKASLTDVLLAQIEEHRTEVFYNLHPVGLGNDFIRKLPSCVKHTIAWRAAPTRTFDFGEYDMLVCNFPSILKDYEQRGWRTSYFYPAHDPEMNYYANNKERPIDVLFIGGYSRHHSRRSEILKTVATCRTELNIKFHLASSRLTKLAESPIGHLPPIRKHRRPSEIRQISAGPIFGRELYSTLSKAKIVLNGAVDMAGEERGNMRCFEAMGCGALLFSDAGKYPQGMRDGTTILTYSNASETTEKLKQIINDQDRLLKIAQAGHQIISQEYSKDNQWKRFQQIVSNI